MGALRNNLAAAPAPSAALERNGEAPAASFSSLFRAKAAQQGMKLTYFGVTLFILVYCARPNEWVPNSHFFPFAKIGAVVALLGFLPALLTQTSKVMPALREMKFLVLLFLHLCLTLPFSTWPGGSTELVFENFSKVVLIALCSAAALASVERLRRVLFIQTMAISVMVLISASGQGKVAVDSAGQVRMRGIVGGIFENPNDFAFAIAIVFPNALAFMLRTRNLFAKVFWAVVSLAMIYVVFQTLSRGGLLALVLSVGMVLWELGIRGRRYALIVVVAVATLGFLVAAPAQFFNRVYSIFDMTKDETGSGWARKALLIKSWNVALQNPLFGVGPGNFGTVSGDWHGAHNTYTQLGSEAGLPAMVLFLLLIFGVIQGLYRTKKNAPTNSEIGLLAGAMFASMTSYAVGAFFADTAYHFFPYLLTGFSVALCRAARTSEVIPPDSASRGTTRARRGQRVSGSAIDNDGAGSRQFGGQPVAAQRRP